MVSLTEIISQFNEYEPDAIGVVIGSTGLNWLDIDERGQSRKLASSLRQCPAYRTSRGEQRILRLDKPIARTIDLRSGGFIGELRGGANFSIIPPSIHREKCVLYKWIRPLPESDLEIPMFRPSQLFTPANSELVRLLIDRVGARRVAKLTRPPSSTPRVISNCVCTRTDWIALTMAKAVGERRSKLPLLAHLMVSEKRDWSVDEVDEVANAWWTEAVRLGVTRDRDGIDSRLALRWLVEHYDPSLSNLLTRVVAIANALDECDEVTQGLRMHASREAMARLAKLCRALSIASNGEPFFLSCRDAARLVGCEHWLANKLLHRLVECGWLRHLDQGTPGVAKGGKAATFQWIPAV